jgi:PTS system galactitol-specific IIA component
LIEQASQWTHENIIIPQLQASTSDAAIEILGELLENQGYVRDTFINAVKEREKVFATGLPTPGIQVAIPHADIEHIIRPAIAIGVSAEPIDFGEMGNPDGTVGARIICMLAVTESETLVSLLQNLVGIFQDPDVLQQIVEASSSTEIAKLFNDRLPNP